VLAVTAPARTGAPKFGFDAAPAAWERADWSASQRVDWNAPDAGWRLNYSYSPFGSALDAAQARRPAANFSEFVWWPGAAAAAKPQTAGYDSLGKSLLGVKKAKL
jgi:hypothetical protein